MNDFTASNGVRIKRAGKELILPDASVVPIWSSASEPAITIRKQVVEAFVEFFQAEADERLGRWRWPENPQWVLYPDDDGDVIALDESTGESFGFLTRASVDQFPNSQGSPAARAYFKAHPQPEPLPDKPGLYTGAHIDGQPSVWWRHGDGSWLLVNTGVRYIGTELRDIEKYAPFTRQVPEMAS